MPPQIVNASESSTYPERTRYRVVLGATPYWPTQGDFAKGAGDVWDRMPTASLINVSPRPFPVGSTVALDVRTTSVRTAGDVTRALVQLVDVVGFDKCEVVSVTRLTTSASGTSEAQAIERDRTATSAAETRDASLLDKLNAGLRNVTVLAFVVVGAVLLVKAGVLRNTLRGK